MLIGIAVNNGIVLVDYANQLRQRGLGVMEATEQSSVTRLRPILITSLTTILALIPMAIGGGEGAEVWTPLGRVTLGGLTVTTFFTLFFIPALYSLIEEFRARRLPPPQTEPLDTDAITDAEVIVAD
jgi:HAE1 family hydrophobic/amphiphilic exporter-1